MNALRLPAARIAPLLSLLVTATMLGACTSGGASSGTTATVQTGTWGGVLNPGGSPVRGGTLRIDQSLAPTGVSPLKYLAEPSNQVGQVVLQLFDRLVEYLPGQLDPQPGLAERWEISPNGTTYTFHLRQATFSNGTPVTSADVKYSLDAARAPDSFYANLYEMITDIQTPDASTVVVTLSQPTPAFLHYAAYVAASVVPAEAVRSMGVEAFNNQPIGSGPFVLRKWVRDQEVHLARNPKYWRAGQPYLDEVRLVSVPDDNTRVLNVQSGTSDVADHVPFAQVETINAGQSASVLVAPGGDMNVIWLNNAKKPLDEVAVRQALNHATPVDSIIDVVFKGLAPRMNTIIPKMKYWTDKAAAYPHDIGKAKQLLATTSVPNGFTVKLSVLGTDQASKQIAQIVQQEWAKIGVTVTIEPMDDPTRSDQVQSGEFEMSLPPPGSFTTDVPVDDEFAQLMFASPQTNNLFTRYANPALAELVKRAVTEQDERARADLFTRIHVDSMANPAVIPLVYTPNRAAVRDRVHDFHYLLGGLWRLDGVWISK